MPLPARSEQVLLRQHALSSSMLCEREFVQPQVDPRPLRMSASKHYQLGFVHTCSFGHACLQVDLARRTAGMREEASRALFAHRRRRRLKCSKHEQRLNNLDRTVPLHHQRRICYAVDVVFERNHQARQVRLGTRHDEADHRQQRMRPRTHVVKRAHALVKVRQAASKRASETVEQLEGGAGGDHPTSDRIQIRTVAVEKLVEASCRGTRSKQAASVHMHRRSWRTEGRPMRNG